MEVVVWVLDRFLALTYALLGSIAGLLVVVPSANNTIHWVQAWGDDLLGRDEVPEPSGSAWDTFRPSDGLRDVGDWLGWDQLQNVGGYVETFFSDPQRYDLILAVGWLLLAGSVVFWVRRDLQSRDSWRSRASWKSMTAATIAAAALAQLGEPMWPILLVALAVGLVFQICAAAAASYFGSLPDEVETLRWCLFGMISTWVLAMVLAPLVVLTAAVDDTRGRSFSRAT